MDHQTGEHQNIGGFWDASMALDGKRFVELSIKQMKVLYEVEEEKSLTTTIRKNKWRDDTVRGRFYDENYYWEKNEGKENQQNA